MTTQVVLAVDSNGIKYNRQWYDAQVIAARLQDEASAAPKYEPLTRLMQITGRTLDVSVDRLAQDDERRECCGRRAEHCTCGMP